MAKEYVRFTTRIDQWKDLFNDLTNDVGDIALLTTGDFVARGGAQGRTDITLGYTFSGADSDLVTAINELDYRMDSTDDLLDQAVLTSSNVNFNQITVGPWNNGTPTATNPLYTISGVTTTNSAGYTIDASLDIILDADGANVYIKDNGVTQFDFSNDGTNKTIDIPTGSLYVTTGTDIYLKPTGDTVYMQGTTSGEQLQFELDTTDQSITASDNFTLSAGGDFYIKPTGDDIFLQGVTSGEEIKITLGTTEQTILASDQLNITSTNDTYISAGGDIYLKPTGDDVIMQGVTATEQLKFTMAAATQTIAASDALVISSTGTTTIDASDDIILDADGADVLLKDAGTQYAAFTNNSGNLIIKSGSTTAATFSGADVTFASNVYMTDSSRANSNFSIGGNALVGGNTELVGNLSILGNTSIGNATSDTVTVTARLASDIVPSTDNSRSLGSSTLQFKDLFVNGIGWIDGIQADSAYISANATVNGNLSVNGNTSIGNATSDTVTVTARLASDIVPDSDNTRSLGSSTLQFKDLWINGIGYIDGIQADSAYISGNATVNGNLSVNGNTTIGDSSSDTVTVTARLASDIVPESDNTRSLGSSTLQFKDLFVDGIGHIDGIDADSATITGNLDVQGLTTLDSATVDGNLSVTGNASITGNLSVDGNTTIGDATSDTVAVNAGISTTLLPTASNQKNLGSSTKKWKDLWISGTADIVTLQAGTATVTGDLDVQGLTTLDSTSVDGTLYVTGNASITGNLNVDGNTTIGNATSDTVTVNARINTDFVPSTNNGRNLGDSSLQWKDLWIDGIGHIDGIDADSATITGNLNVDGLTSLDSTSVGGTLDVTSNTTIGGTLGVTGAVTANAGINVDNINIDGTTINLSSGSLTVSAATDIYLKPTGDDVIMQGITTGEQLQFTLGTAEQKIAASDNLKLTGAEFTVDASLDIILDAAGGDIKGLKDGVQFVRFQQDNNNNVVIYSGDSAALSFDSDLNLLIRSGQLYDSNLSTTNKGVTDAINELNDLIGLLDSGASEQLSTIGNLTSLNTTAKNTLVAAINETYNRIPNIYDENDTLLN